MRKFDDNNKFVDVGETNIKNLLSGSVSNRYKVSGLQNLKFMKPVNKNIVNGKVMPEDFLLSSGVKLKIGDL